MIGIRFGYNVLLKSLPTLGMYAAWSDIRTLNLSYFIVPYQRKYKVSPMICLIRPLVGSSPSRIRSNRYDHRTDWWTKTPMPCLKAVGCRLAALHSSSANFERHFSAMNRTLTCDRNRMHVITLFKLVAIGTFLHSGGTPSRPQPQSISFDNDEIETAGT